MSVLLRKTSPVLLLLALLPACGDQLVEFPLAGDEVDAATGDVDARNGDVDARNGDAGLADAGLDGSNACSLQPVALGSAAGFAVLAGATVTSTGPTQVTGDLGVSPGSAVVGFPPGNVTGAQHAGDAVAAQATADLTTAYDDAAGRTLCAITVAGNLGGMTLTPGLYHSTSSLEVTSGDLTLDAQGDAGAVFIFQMASTLTTSPGRRVVLAGDARAANVYWQVGTSATLGTTSAFHGTIMADQAITIGTGATLDGRALARIAAVTMASNTVTKP
ncbi:MAG TPA: ice-binding family protein [Kofleriaceae bacterium]|nr:ice-binding family protein [Kofleriaceae bacterium]